MLSLSSAGWLIGGLSALVFFLLIIFLKLLFGYLKSKNESPFHTSKPEDNVIFRAGTKIRMTTINDGEMPKVKKGSVREKDRHEKLGFWQKSKLRRKPESSYLVEIFFSNGTSKEFVIISSGETFQYKKRTYYLRTEDSRFNLTQREYKLYYHEDVSTPIDFDILKQEDKDAAEGQEKAFFSVTPHNLKPLLKMEYIKVLAMSQELTKYLKLLVIAALFNLLLSGFAAYQLYQMTRGK